MSFQIIPLAKAKFEPFFRLSASELAGHRACRMQSGAGMPCRVSLEDAAEGETVLLINYTHLDTRSPYHASHAICVREQAREAQLAAGEVPPAIQARLISARLFDAAETIVGSDVFDGQALASFLEEGLHRPDVAFAHIHFARNGCFAAKAVRA